MHLKSLMIAVTIGFAGAALAGCVSESSSYDSGYRGPDRYDSGIRIERREDYRPRRDDGPRRYHRDDRDNRRDRDENRRRRNDHNEVRDRRNCDDPRCFEETGNDRPGYYRRGDLDQ